MSKKLLRFVSLILALVMLFVGSNMQSFALTDEEQQKVDEYEKKQKELQDKIDAAQAEIDKIKVDIEDKEAYAAQLNTQIENYQAQIDVLNGNITELETKISEIQVEIDKLDAEIATINEDIENNNTKIQETEEEITNLYTELKQRLYELYVNGTMSELELLLDFDQSNDFSTYLILLELNKQRVERDDVIVELLNGDIAELENLNKSNELLIAEIEVKKDEQQSKIDVLDEKKSQYDVSKAKLESSQNELVTLQEEAYSYIQQLNSESQTYKDLVASYEKDIKAFDDKIDAIVNSVGTGDGNIASVPGGFIWPLQYSDVYISSSFGYRYDPISGVYKLHGGTDTCCWSGTSGKAVRASADGTVIISTWHSAYGYYVGIDHGNGIVTIYAHNSALNVSVGQSVKQGDIVAYAGSTGYSTGAHCHFEVRINGTKVNPTGYASLPN